MKTKNSPALYVITGLLCLFTFLITSCGSQSETTSQKNKPGLESTSENDSVYLKIGKGLIFQTDSSSEGLTGHATYQFDVATYPDGLNPPDQPTPIKDKVDKFTFKLELNLDASRYKMHSKEGDLPTVSEPCTLGDISYGPPSFHKDSSLVKFDCTLDVDQGDCDRAQVDVSGGLVVIVQDAFPDSLGTVSITNPKFWKEESPVPHGVFHPASN